MAEIYRRAEEVEERICMKDRVLAPDWWVRCQDKMSRWLEDRREEEGEVWHECNEGCDEGVDEMRLRAEGMVMEREMREIEVSGRGRVQYVVVPVALATGAGAGSGEEVRLGGGGVGGGAVRARGRRRRGRGARQRRRERRLRERSRMGRQSVELVVLMREGIACMADGGDGVVVWEGAWRLEEEVKESTRRTVEQRN